MIKLEQEDLDQIANDIRYGHQSGIVQDKVYWSLDLWEKEKRNERREE